MSVHEAAPAGAPIPNQPLTLEQMQQPDLSAELMSFEADFANQAPVVPEATIAPVAEQPEYVGRHRAPEVGRHRAPEVEAAPEAANPNRFMARVANRVAGFANRMANRANNVSENVSNRRTASEVARDKAEAARASIRKVGASAVESTLTLGNMFADTYEDVVETGKEGVNHFRGVLHDKAEAARAHKTSLVGRIKNRMDKIETGIRSGVEATAERTTRAAKVGGEVLKVSGLIALGVGTMTAEAIGQGAKRGAQKTSEKARAGAGVVGREVKTTVNNIRENAADIRTANIEHSAQKAQAKHARKSAQAAARRAQAN